MNKREIKDFDNSTQKIINILKLHSTQTILGTSGDKQMDYYNDIDLQETNICKNEKDVYIAILKMFQKKFKEIDKIPNTFITDFKCGVQRGNVPVRWDKKSIKEGQQIIDNKLYRFIDCLQQTSIIKLDIIALIDGKFTEFSENYYFTFGKRKTYRTINKSEVLIGLLREFKKYIANDKPFKALKRLYSYKKINDSVNKQMINFLNSKTGKLNKIVGDLEIIDTIMDFDIDETIIRNNIRIIAEEADKYKDNILEISYLPLEELRNSLIQLIEKIKKHINKRTMNFIEKNVEL